jgi:hypothetical protein
MTISDRDRRALLLLAIAGGAILAYYFFTSSPGQAAVVNTVDSVPLAEKRLARVRELAAQVPGKEQVLKQVRAELAQREKGLLQAETAAQAQAQLLQIMKRVGKAQNPPIDFRGQEFGQARLLGQDYGEVFVSVSTECAIEQIVNLLADLTAQPELVATNELRFGAVNPKQKLLSVRLTVSGVVPRRLIPEKKGPQY